MFKTLFIEMKTPDWSGASSVLTMINRVPSTENNKTQLKKLEALGKHSDDPKFKLLQKKLKGGKFQELFSKIREKEKSSLLTAIKKTLKATATKKELREMGFKVKI